MSKSKLLRLSSRAVLMLMFLLMGGSAFADTIFVDSVQGNDAFTGTSATFQGSNVGPVQTIGRALQLADAGDTISIEAGTYNESVDASDANLIFEARVDGSQTVVQVTGNLVVDQSGLRIGTQGAGTFRFDGSVALQSGSVQVQNVALSSGVSITATEGTATGTFVFPGAVFVTYNGANSRTQGAELPADLNGGDLTVQFTAANKSLTLNAPVEVDDVTLNSNSAVAGTVRLSGNGGGDAHQVNGNGGTITAVSITQAGDIDNTKITQDLDVNASGATVSLDNGTSIGGELDIDAGTVRLDGNITAMDVLQATGSTLTLQGNTLSITRNFDRDGGTFNGTAGGTLLFTGTANDGRFDTGIGLTVSNMTVAKSGRTLTLDNTVNVQNSLTVTPNTSVDTQSNAINITGAANINVFGTMVSPAAGGGGLVFLNGSTGASIEGDGFSNITLLDGIVLNVEDVDGTGAGSTLNTDGAEFSGILSLFNGRINVNNGADLSAEGSSALIEVNLSNANTTITGVGTGSVGGNNQDFDLKYFGTLTASRAVGLEFATGDINDLMFQITDGNNFTLNAAGAIVNAPNNTISGNVTANAVTGTGNDPYTVTFPSTKMAGSVSVGRGVTFNGGPIEVESTGPVTVTGTISAPLTLDGALTVTGSADNNDQAVLGNVTVDNNETVTLSNIQVMNSLTANTGSNVTLGMAQETDVNGAILLNGASFALASDIDLMGNLTVNSGTFNFGGNELDLMANNLAVIFDRDVTSITSGGTGGVLEVSGTGIVLDANGETLPRLQIDEDLTLNDLGDAAGAMLMISEAFTQSGSDDEIIGNGNNVTLSGSATINGGTFYSGTGEFISNGATITLSNNADLSNLLVQGSGATINSSSDDLTVSGELEMDAGTFTQDETDVIFTGTGLNYDGGSFVSTSGYLQFNSGNIDAASSFEVDFLSVENPGNTVTLNGSGTTAITVDQALALQSGTFDGDGDTDLVLNSGATLIRWDDGMLGFTTTGETRTFNDFISVVYGDAGAMSGAIGNTGSELPGTVTNLTIWDPTSLDSDVTVQGRLRVADPFNTTANDIGNVDDDVTLAVNATLELEANGTLNESPIFAGAYNLEYDDYAVGTTSDTEFPDNANVTTLTIDAATTLALHESRTVGNISVTDDAVNIGTLTLGATGNVTFSGDGTLSASNGTLEFSGGNAQTFAPGSIATVPAGIDIRLNKTGMSAVTLSGNLDLRTNNGAGAADTNLDLDGGLLVTGDNIVTLFQGNVVVPNVGAQPDQGFTRTATAANPSHVVGNVRKSVDNANTVDNTRIDFPVGDDDGNYRMAQFFFTAAPQSNVDLTVSHSDAAPGGSNGFPLDPADPAFDIGGASDFYWFVRSDQTLSPGTQYDIALMAEDPAEGDDSYVFDPANIDRLRIVRRQGPVSAVNNPWSVQGGNYDNFVDANNDPTLVARQATGNITSQGIVFAYGSKDEAPTIAAIADANVDEGGTFTVTAAGTDPNGTPVTYSLVNAPSFVSINASTGEITANPGPGDAGTYQITVRATSGNLSAETTFALTVNNVVQPGDANNDDKVNAADASIALQNAAGLITLTAAQEAAFDVSCPRDGDFDAEDASRILQFSVGLIANFNCTAPGAVMDDATSRLKGDLGWGEVVREGNTLSLPVVLDNSANVNSMMLTLSLPKGVSLQNVVTSLPEGWMALHNEVDGEVKVALAGASALSNGTIATLKLTVDGAADQISGVGQIGNLEARSFGAADVTTLPTEFAVSENYPNPFTAGTTFTIDLPQADEVNVTVFDLQGRVIATLLSGAQEAGTYTIQWDGSSDAGTPMAAGVYFYRVQTGETVVSKKMTLIK